MESIDALGNSVRETDRLALRIFRLLKGRSAEDRRLVLIALKTGTEVLAPRAHLVRCAISRFEDECGTTVSKQRYEKWRVASNDRSLPSASYIASTHGGTWAKAMDAIGKQPALEHAAFRLRARGKSPSKEEVLQAIAQCAEELGVDSLRFSDYRAWAKKKQPHLSGGAVLLVAPGSINSRFGSFTRACILAGLTFPSGRMGPWAGSTRYTEETAIEAIEQASDEVEESGSITQARYSKWRKSKYEEAMQRGEWVSIPSFITIRNIFGSWLKALQAAGLLSEDAVANHARGRGMKMSPRLIAEGLLRAVDSLGPTFTVRAYDRWRADELMAIDRPRPPSVTVLKKTFGNWPKVTDCVGSSLRHADPLVALSDLTAHVKNGE